MASAEHFIRAVLGSDAETFECRIAGQKRKAWRRFFPGDDDRRRARKVVKDHWRDCYESGVPLFVGQSMYRLATGEYVDRVEMD